MKLFINLVWMFQYSTAKQSCVQITFVMACCHLDSHDMESEALQTLTPTQSACSRGLHVSQAAAAACMCQTPVLRTVPTVPSVCMLQRPYQGHQQSCLVQVSGADSQVLSLAECQPGMLQVWTLEKLMGAKFPKFCFRTDPETQWVPSSQVFRVSKGGQAIAVG